MHIFTTADIHGGGETTVKGERLTSLMDAAFCSSKNWDIDAKPLPWLQQKSLRAYTAVWRLMCSH